jgi:hypothetical protein
MFVGLGALQASGCLSAVDDGSLNKNDQVGTCVLPTDDGNPCTIERCLGGNPVNAPAAQGTPIDDDIIGDCKGRQCDGKGDIKVVNLDSDVPPPDKDCFVYQCSNGQKMEVPACMTGVCTGASKCVACVQDADCKNGEYCFENDCFDCTDGTQNGDEKGVDCGGDHCKKCNGDACQSAAECKDGFCADGVCCNSACTEPCKSCNLMGSPAGTCTSIPEFGSDSSYTSPTTGETIVCLAADGQACSSSGACLLLAGGTCTKNADCISGTCGTTPNGMICKGKPGEPCGADNTICASGKCSSGKCT